MRPGDGTAHVASLGSVNMARNPCGRGSRHAKRNIALPMPENGGAEVVELPERKA